MVLERERGRPVPFAPSTATLPCDSSPTGADRPGPQVPVCRGRWRQAVCRAPEISDRRRRVQE
jgi:hypothetical protein